MHRRWRQAPGPQKYDPDGSIARCRGRPVACKLRVMELDAVVALYVREATLRLCRKPVPVPTDGEPRVVASVRTQRA
jgi:hypothetical protein